MTENTEPLYRARGNQVFHRSVERTSAAGYTSRTMGFLVCTVSEAVSGDNTKTEAELVAQLLNLGSVAPDALKQLKECLDAELARRQKLLPGAPATAYCEARIARVRDAISKVEALLK